VRDPARARIGPAPPTRPAAACASSPGPGARPAAGARPAGCAARSWRARASAADRVARRPA
jgi:hypothetical protein